MAALEEADEQDGEGDGGGADGGDDEDGRASGGEGSGAEGDGEDFEAEEDEEDGVLDFVEGAPGAVEGFVGDFGVGVGGVEGAESEAGGDGFEWGRDVKELGEGVAAERDGEGEQELDGELFDAAHELGGEEGEGDAEEEAAAGFDDEQEADVGEGGRGAAGGFEDGEEEDGADAVVEEGFAGELGLDVAGNADAVQHFEYGDGISGGNERAEEEAFEPGGMKAGEAEERVHERRDAGHGDERGDEREQRDAELFAAEVFEVEKEGSGEEEEAEHAVEDEVFEVNAADERDGPGVEAGEGAAEDEQGERREEREQHGAEHDGQAQDTAAEPSEAGGGGEEDADEGEGGHGFSELAG